MQHQFGSRYRGWAGWGMLLGVGAAVSASAADATPPPPVSGADTLWVLLAAALVMLMTPGLAFFYGGLVRRKNILSILMQCFMMLCLISLQWVICGYSLSFGPDLSHFIGSLDWLGFNHVGMAPSAYAPTIPHQAFAIFQMMFAVITPALICGAFAERMKFAAFCVFAVLWATLVYDPVCHWLWGAGGFLGHDGMGAVDFAGGLVVHINAGMAALAAVLVLGKRHGFPHNISPPHNLPFAVLGAGLLWFGWYGFNAGSALSIASVTDAVTGQVTNVALTAFLNTHTAGAVAGLVWCILDWARFGKPTTLGMITGAVAGLAAVTPGAGYVTLTGATCIGIGSGVICWLSVTAFKAKFEYDDTLDAFGVHGIGGIWGSLAVGLWATKSVNPAGVDGMFYGNAAQFLIQAKAVGIVMVYSFVASWLLFLLVGQVLKLRVSHHDEAVGLDLTQHRESGYTVID